MPRAFGRAGCRGARNSRGLSPSRPADEGQRVASPARDARLRPRQRPHVRGLLRSTREGRRTAGHGQSPARRPPSRTRPTPAHPVLHPLRQAQPLHHERRRRPRGRVPRGRRRSRRAPRPSPRPLPAFPLHQQHPRPRTPTDLDGRTQLPEPAASRSQAPRQPAIPARRPAERGVPDAQEGRPATIFTKTEQVLRDAMERLLSGRPQHTDGKLTKNNLCREAGVSRVTRHRAAKILTEWDARTATSSAGGTPAPARRRTRRVLPQAVQKPQGEPRPSGTGRRHGYRHHDAPLREPEPPQWAGQQWSSGRCPDASA